jgi:hypothetical protein
VNKSQFFTLLPQIMHKNTRHFHNIFSFAMSSLLTMSSSVNSLSKIEQIADHLQKTMHNLVQITDNLVQIVQPSCSISKTKQPPHID